MKKPIIKFFDKIILLLLGFVGILYSCAKYGMPVDEFEIKGAVTDITHVPIKNIRVVQRGGGHSESGDTSYTNPQGQYAFKLWGGHNMRLKVEDIDGEENGGEFLPIEFDVQFTGADLVKKGKRDKTPSVYSKTIDITLLRDGEYPPIAYGPPSAPFEP
jgi:putative lipoprotein (rSAM/lipoprotein system)